MELIGFLVEDLEKGDKILTMVFDLINKAFELF